MADHGLLLLAWKNHSITFSNVISTLRDKGQYTDVTVSCEGKFYPAHKLVLSACSQYFEEMFQCTPCKHPVIVLKGVSSSEMEALLSYMYSGSVSVAQSDLTSLIKAAELLQVKGLAIPDETSGSSQDTNNLHSPPRKRLRREEEALSPSFNKQSPGQIEEHRQPQRQSEEKTNRKEKHRSSDSVVNSRHDRVEQNADLVPQTKEDSSGCNTEECPNEPEYDVKMVKMEVPESPDGLSGETPEGSEYPGPPGDSESHSGPMQHIDHNSALEGFDTDPMQYPVQMNPSTSSSASHQMAGPSGMQRELPVNEGESYPEYDIQEHEGIFDPMAVQLELRAQQQQQQQQQQNAVQHSGGQEYIEEGPVNVRHNHIADQSLVQEKEFTTPSSYQDMQNLTRTGNRLTKHSVGTGENDLDDDDPPHVSLYPVIPSMAMKRYSQPFPSGQRPSLQVIEGENEQYFCPLCPYQSCRKGDVTKHMRIHTGEKPFSCRHCKRSFSQSSHLKLHLSVHTGEKPFLCPVCRIAFARKGTMLKHLQTHDPE